MKRIFPGSVFAVFAATAAFAADLPAKAPAQVYQPAFDWSGFYGGVSGGYGWGENRIADEFTFADSQTLKPGGGFGGVQLGYNSQFAPHWLIGGEIDLSAGDLRDDTTVGGITMKDKFDSFGTARTRLGYVQDR